MAKKADKDKKQDGITPRQNRALHKYFSLVAERLNEAGIDMKLLLDPRIDIAWNTEMVKEYLWRDVQQAKFFKESTQDLTDDELNAVYDELNRFFAEKVGFHEPFPSLETIAAKLEAERAGKLKTKDKK